jgi:predicted O-methyltransferase YrrM
MSAVEQRFARNVAIARSRSRSSVSVRTLKGGSMQRLASLLAEGHGGSFDFIHVDGSHQCPVVLCDAVLAFQLCRVGGVMVFDDYVWSQEQHGNEDLLNQPKLAIDSFVNCHLRKIELLGVNVRQMYIGKTAD